MDPSGLPASSPAPPLVAQPWLLALTSDDPASAAALSLLTATCHPAIAHHGARTLRYALQVAEREQLSIDRAALVCACLLHDIGASALSTGAERFEVQGADTADALLVRHAWSPQRRAAVWAAVAVHTSPHIAERLSPLARLVRLGVRADFGEALVPTALRRATEAEHPRLRVERVLSGVVVEQAELDERRAPGASWPGALLAAHRAGGGGPDARLGAF